MVKDISVTPLGYFNVLLLMFAKDDFERSKVYQYEQSVKTWRKLRLKDFSAWCNAQGITYDSRFIWREDYPFTANLWNLYSYLRWQYTEGRLLRGHIDPKTL